MEKVFNTYHFLAVEYETSIDEIDRLVWGNIQMVDKILKNKIIKRKANRF